MFPQVLGAQINDDGVAQVFGKSLSRKLLVFRTNSSTNVIPKSSGRFDGKLLMTAFNQDASLLASVNNGIFTIEGDTKRNVDTFLTRPRNG